MNIINVERLNLIPAKQIYEDYTFTFPPPKVIYRHSDLPWEDIWRRLNRPILESLMKDILFTLLILILPLAIGPLLTAILELIHLLTNYQSKCGQSENSLRGRHLALLHVLAWLSIGSYLANLYLAEGVLLNIYNFNIFHILVFKYVLGYADLIFVPVIIIIMDQDVREGVSEIYKSKRMKKSETDISVF